MKKTLLTAGLTLSLLGASGFVSAKTIDFEDLSAGTVVTNQYAGVHFSLDNTPAGYVAGPVVGVFSDGNHVIMPGDDDHDPFYTIDIKFDSDIDYFAITSFDSDEPYVLRAYKDGVYADIEFWSAKGGDTEIFRWSLGAVGGSELFDEVKIWVTNGKLGGNAGGPEYWDNLTYNPVPEPATMLLFGSGIAGLAGLRRKMKKS